MRHRADRGWRREPLNGLIYRNFSSMRERERIAPVVQIAPVFTVLPGAPAGPRRQASIRNSRILRRRVERSIPSNRAARLRFPRQA